MAEYLSRDAVLAAQDLKTEEVECPEWGGTVLVRELTASESEQLGFNMLGVGGAVDPKKAKGMMLQCVLWGAINEKGERLFFKKDLKELGGKSSAPITRLAEKIMDMSDLRKKEEEGEDGEDPNEPGED